jgi:hypothetical protein
VRVLLNAALPKSRGMPEFAGAYGVGRGGGYHEPLIQISFFCNFCYQIGPGCKHDFIGVFRMLIRTCLGK